MAGRERLDVARCEALARRAAGGDDAAWRELTFEHLWPAWASMVKASRFMGPLRSSDDHVHNVRERLVEKLRSGIKRYPEWQERRADKTFEDWIKIVTANVIRRYVEEQLGDAMAAAAADPSVKQLLNEFATSPLIDRLSARPPITAAQTARQMLEFAAGRLETPHYRALALWIEGASFEDIAADLGLGGAREAEGLQRAAVAVLRREFR